VEVATIGAKERAWRPSRGTDGQWFERDRFIYSEDDGIQTDPQPQCNERHQGEAGPAFEMHTECPYLQTLTLLRRTAFNKSRKFAILQKEGVSALIQVEGVSVRK
jgi:hypothetical protein